jgi:hypothetical protein
MQRKRLIMLALTGLLALGGSTAQAGVRVGIGIGLPLGCPWGYYGPYYPAYYPYYPYYPGYVYAAPAAVVQPAPAVVQPAPAVQAAPAVAPQPVAATQQSAAPPSWSNPSVTPAVALDNGGVADALRRLSQPDEQVRSTAAMQLGRLKAEQAVDPLAATLAGDQSPAVRETAARALGLVGSKRALTALIHAAQADADRDVRRSAQPPWKSFRPTRVVKPRLLSKGPRFRDRLPVGSFPVGKDS